MRTMTFVALAFAGLLFTAVQLSADAAKSDWIGEWSMNHDGFVGSLRIAGTKADCASPAWCDMAISYADRKGVRHAGRIGKIDEEGQHMLFFIDFPGNRQQFDAYIFSWDKRKLAGTTLWGGRTFGFFATKR